jgi:hypothetical protein
MVNDWLEHDRSILSVTKERLGSGLAPMGICLRQCASHGSITHEGVSAIWRELHSHSNAPCVLIGKRQTLDRDRNFVRFVPTADIVTDV